MQEQLNIYLDNKKRENKQSKIDKWNVIIEKLSDYANIEVAEAGEYWGLLVQLAEYKDGDMSKLFRKALKREIKDIVDWVEDNFEVVEEEITEVRKDRRLECKSVDISF